MFVAGHIETHSRRAFTVGVPCDIFLQRNFPESFRSRVLLPESFVWFRLISRLAPSVLLVGSSSRSSAGRTGDSSLFPICLYGFILRGTGVEVKRKNILTCSSCSGFMPENLHSLQGRYPFFRLLLSALAASLALGQQVELAGWELPAQPGRGFRSGQRNIV